MEKSNWHYNPNDAFLDKNLISRVKFTCLEWHKLNINLTGFQENSPKNIKKISCNRLHVYLYLDLKYIKILKCTLKDICIIALGMNYKNLDIFFHIIKVVEMPYFNKWNFH